MVSAADGWSKAFDGCQNQLSSAQLPIAKWQLSTQDSLVGYGTHAPSPILGSSIAPVADRIMLPWQSAATYNKVQMKKHCQPQSCTA